MIDATNSRGSARGGQSALEHELPAELAMLTALDRPEALARSARTADWSLAIAVARQQRLLGQLAMAVQDAGLSEIVPEEHQSALESEQERRDRWFHRRVLPQLAELCDHLLDVGITPVLLKGAALVCSGVVPAAGRPMADLDILVRHEEIELASDVLRGLGYAHRVPEAERRWAREHHYQDPAWYRPDQPLGVEIHWDLMTRRHRLAFDTRTLGRSMLTLPGGQRVSRLDDPGQLTHLALHFWRDRRAGSGAALGQLWDIHRCARALTAAQWAELREAAESRGHLHVLAAVIACDRLVLGGHDAPTWTELETLVSDPRLRSFALRRVVASRPVALQLLMVTDSVDYTPYRVATRLLAQIRRPPDTLGSYGRGSDWRLRLRHLVRLMQLLLALLRSPTSAWAEIRIDRWAHRLR